jgi:transposase
MAPLRGWGLIGRAPFGHWNTMTFTAALRHDGIIAPRVIDGPISGEGFRTWAGQVLVPALRPGDIVVMDNLGSHKAPATRHAIRAAGAKLFYLPACCPDLNPIGQAIAKLKHLRRKAAERTGEAVWRRIGPLLDQFTPQECENYIRNAGYGSVQGHPALTGC